MDDDVIDLLKAHEYFRGISGAILGEIASFAKVTNYDAAAVIHQLNDPLTSICFILRGRLKAVRVDSRGDEHLFQIFERGEQYGIMLGGLGESIPVRIFAGALDDPEPGSRKVDGVDAPAPRPAPAVVTDLRPQLAEAVFEPTSARAPKLLAMLHESPATRNLAQEIIGRLQGLGKRSPFSATRSPGGRYPMWGSVRCWTATDSSRWQRFADRLLSGPRPNASSSMSAAQNLDWAVLLRPADCALVFIRPREISSAIERLRALDLASQGWRDKIAIVWLLEEGSSVAPVVPELHDFASREFKICASPLPHPWGKVHSTSMERLVHYLRGVRIGIALGGGAARGMAHLGVLNALDQHGIVVDVIAGTSAGAMTGVLYAAGLDCAYLTSQFAADLKPRGSSVSFPTAVTGTSCTNTAAASSIRWCENTCTTGSWSNWRYRVSPLRPIWWLGTRSSGTGGRRARGSKASTCLCFRPPSAETDRH